MNVSECLKNGKMGVLNVIGSNQFGDRLTAARWIRADEYFRNLAYTASFYLMGDRPKEAAFWMLLAIKYGRSCDAGFVEKLRIVRRHGRGLHVITMAKGDR